jgi:rubrerythrin
METLEALNQALQNEGEAQSFYNDAAAKSTNAKGKKMFEWLAREETGHIRLLEQTIKDLKDNERWPTRDMWGSIKHISKPIVASDIPSKPETMGDLAPDSSELDIIKRAIEAEKIDEEFYKKLAESIEDPNGKIMVEKLAHVEKGHATMLEEEYEWLHHSKDMFTLHRFSPAGH